MAQLSPEDRHFLLRRLHSLSGIIPIGGFLLFHFFENASARHGAEKFNATVEKIAEMPYLYLLEIGLLLIPILFHSIYGLFITASARPNVANYGYVRNWAYLMQRVTGVIGFIYLALHIATTRGWALFVKGAPITFADMQLMLQQPMFLALYLLGILSLTFHFSNGIWSFSITWGLVRSPVGQRRLALATMGLFLVLAVVGIDIVSAFIVPNGILAQLGLKFFGV